ncbi:MAG: response regulator [Myxococcota bacterium]|nr:response regulator [Myxococcota bacterium]
MKELLIVDDDDIFRARLAKAFKNRGIEVFEACDYASALGVVESYSPGCALLDLRMPGPSGLELLKAILARNPDTKVVMLTGYGSIATAVEAIQLGAYNYLAKPVEADAILASFTNASESVDVEASHAPSLARTEWEHINRVLNDCGGNISEAARRLKIHRRSLQRKLQKYPPGD